MDKEIIYHVYNRGNNREDIFYTDSNYDHFLYLLDKYLGNYIELYAYCLMPNHFHLMLMVKASADEKKVCLSNQFRKLFQTYAQYINRQEFRVGSLFQKNLKRKEIADMSYFASLVAYIHFNPVKAKIVDQYKDWPYSSFLPFYTDAKETRLNKKKVLKVFGGRERLLKFHNNYKEIQMNPYHIDWEV